MKIAVTYVTEPYTSILAIPSSLKFIRLKTIKWFLLKP